MSSREEVDRALARLQNTFPHSKVTKDTLAVYVEKLSRLGVQTLDRAVEGAITKCTYFPKISELLAFADGAPVGKARTSHEKGKWEPDEMAANVAFAHVLQTGTAQERYDASERNNAIWEAKRRAHGGFETSSHFSACICEKKTHPHTLDAALERYGLDYFGNPLTGHGAMVQL